MCIITYRKLYNYNMLKYMCVCIYVHYINKYYQTIEYTFTINTKHMYVLLLVK